MTRDQATDVLERCGVDPLAIQDGDTVAIIVDAIARVDFQREPPETVRLTDQELDELEQALRLVYPDLPER